MKQSVFDSLQVVDSLETAVLPVSAGGVPVGDYFLLTVDQNQTSNRITYYQRIDKIRDNETVDKVMPRTNRVIPGWEQGDNPPPRVVERTDGITKNTYFVTETITASGSWPSGAIGYDTSGKTVTQLTYPDFKPGTSQQTDGYVRIYDILEEG